MKQLRLAYERHLMFISKLRRIFGDIARFVVESMLRPYLRCCC